MWHNLISWKSNLYLRWHTLHLLSVFIAVCLFVGSTERVVLVDSWLLLLAATQDFQLRRNANTSRSCRATVRAKENKSHLCSVALCYIKVLMAAGLSLKRRKHPPIGNLFGKLTRRGGVGPAPCWPPANARLRRQRHKCEDVGICQGMG